MPRKAAVEDNIYQDEAEGFLLEHSLLELPRTWPPVAPESGPSAQAVRLEAASKKMDWNNAETSHDDDEMAEFLRTKDEDADKERCVICLMALRDRTIVGICGHEFCFSCIGVWANQSRRCPLCSADMAPFLLHDLDAKSPTKFYLPPLPQPRQLPSASIPSTSRQAELEERWGQKDRLEELDIQVLRRRDIYKHELYVKHVASNTSTRFRPNPTPRQFSEDQGLINRATTFLRRELRVWSLVDVEFLTTYIISLLKAIDIRSEPAIRLIAEFLDTPNGPQYPHGAEHFAHELYTFLRSPHKDLRRYDEFVQYDPLPSERRNRANSRLSSSGSSSSSRSRSPIRSPRRRRDTYRPSKSPTAKRWNEHDTWLDPDYEAWLKEERQREKERLDRRYARKVEREYPGVKEEKPMRSWGTKQVELLPDTEIHAPLRMMEPESEPGGEKDDKPVISIKGAAITERKLSLVERLAKAKLESQNKSTHSKPEIPQNHPQPQHAQAPLSPSNSNMPQLSVGARTIVQARLKLRLKLQAEKERSLASSSARTSYATVLRPRTKSIDVENRQAELKRRLLIAKVLLAETDQERKERELRERLYKRKLEKAAGEVVDVPQVGYVVKEDRPRELELKAKLAARRRSGIGNNAGAVKVETAVEVEAKEDSDLDIEGEGAELYDM